MASENRQLVNDCFSRMRGEVSSEVARLLKEPPGDAAAAGLEVAMLAVRIVLEELGGLLVHFPSIRTLEIEVRDTSIVQAYRDGFPYEDIAEKHGITPREVRRIIHEKGRG